MITKDGKPVAALVDAALFERIRRMQDRFDASSERLARAYETVPEDEGVAEIERAGARARRETTAEWRAQGRLPPVLEVAEPARTRRAGNKAGREAKTSRSTSGR